MNTQYWDHKHIQGTLQVSLIAVTIVVTLRVLITATDMRVTPMKLVFFNNYENGPHGKGNVSEFTLYFSCFSIDMIT